MPIRVSPLTSKCSKDESLKVESGSSCKLLEDTSSSRRSGSRDRHRARRQAQAPPTFGHIKFRHLRSSLARRTRDLVLLPNRDASCKLRATSMASYGLTTRHRWAPCTRLFSEPAVDLDPKKYTRRSSSQALLVLCATSRSRHNKQQTAGRARLRLIQNSSQSWC